VNRLDANANPAQIARLLAAARQNAEKLAAIDDSDRATLALGCRGESSTGAISIPGHQLICEIHRGGQGVVYQAIRESTGRDVAIKVLHDRRAASPRELERFEREAAVLRELNHPNLIAINEVGVVDGRPFLVMPYIPGWPLDEHVRRNSLSVDETLALFLKVCDAVNVAHLNGVIHRDLKPSNIRVDDTGEPHVLDFGLAKNTAASMGETLTETGQFVGSMPWASPEQADPGLGRVDIRTDVYSLGAVLYQLLTGRLPIDPIGSQREVLNRIVTVDPMSLRSHRTEINDEVETIVLRCLNKDRARRYANAGALAADVRRYLSGDPIEAKRDSIIYVARKLIRRHRGSVLAIGLVVLVGAAAGTASFVLWQQTEDARRAESAQRGRAEAINSFLTEMLTAADPAKAKGIRLTVREALDSAAERIEHGALRDQPLVEADIRLTIASTYYALHHGPNSQAEAQFRAAAAIQSRMLGDEHPDTLRTRFHVARSLIRIDPAGAASAVQPILETQIRVLGPDHRDTLRSMVLLGYAQTHLGRFVEGESILREAIERRARTLGSDDVDTTYFLNRLGEAYAFNYFSEKAEPLHREALRIYLQAFGEDHPDTFTSMRDLAQSLNDQHRPEESELILRRMLDRCIRVLGPENGETLSVQSDLAFTLVSQARYAEAEPMYRETLALQTRTLGPADHNTIVTQQRLAQCLTRQAKYAEAETLLRESLDAAREKFGPENADTVIPGMSALANVLSAQHKDAEAEPFARKVLDYHERTLTRTNIANFNNSSRSLIALLQRRGADDEALRVEQRQIATLVSAAREADAFSETVDLAAYWLVKATFVQLRDPQQGLALAQRLNEKVPQSTRYLRTLARAYLANGDKAQALQTWEQAIASSSNDASRALTLNFAARELLLVTPEAVRDPAAALKYAQEANRLTSHNNPGYLDSLALAYHRSGQTAKAIEIQNRAIALLAADARNRADYEKKLIEFQTALEEADVKTSE